MYEHEHRFTSTVGTANGFIGACRCGATKWFPLQDKVLIVPKPERDNFVALMKATKRI